MLASEFLHLSLIFKELIVQDASAAAGKSFDEGEFSVEC